jgi:dehydrogenase/reductase SDR family protein 4|eukprot:TRINITY_DN4870_c0_g1_i1.p1 TRINITY_DN4870_c0_g1~~TRINITY_DN4870_c0_g1_i1.p1  ORF type:complete len:280 (+),score=187.14 TRINITY_DN4870_c0_g1_i1:70-840(+)
MSSAPALRLLNKVSVVTAATKGIGFAIADRLLRDGATVVISSRGEANVNDALTELRTRHDPARVHGTVCHVGDAASREKLIGDTMAQHGRIDVLVSNAAVNPIYGPLTATTPEAFDKIMDTNVKASLFLALEAKKHLQRGASVLFVSSIGGEMPLEGLGAYCVSKTALFGLSKVCAKEWGPEGIRVNCLAPGLIETKFSEALHTDPKIKAMIERNTPLRRFGQPEEMGDVAAFLVSDEARFITGETIFATGGLCRL